MSVEDQTLFLQQLANANIHSTSSWHREQEIAKALKIAQDDENYEDEAIGLEKLGDVYVERAGLNHESSSVETSFARLDQLILATALYNSSFVRTTQDEKRYELIAKLRQLEEEIIKQCGKNINKRDFKYDIDRDHKKKLDEFRETCREKLNYVQSNFNVFASPLHDTDTASEERRASEIEELFIEIQAFVKEFVSRLLDECVEVLGSAPEGVSYAFVAFGSFPRKEVTPYSDLESALLFKIEEDKDTSSCDVKDYFVKLTEYFNFKVLNLQETILPSMSIASLNDLNNEMNSLESLYKCTACTNEESDDDHNREVQQDSFLDEDRDWFYDNQMRGFSVDGRMSKACKTPLGCLVQGRGRSNDLIKTPEEMAELYTKSLKFDRDVSQRKREGNDYNLSTVLSNVSFLYGNDQSLVELYDCLVLSLTEDTHGDTKLNHRQASAVGCLRDALDEFQFSLNASDIGLISSIKKKLYRVVDLLLANLGKLQYPGVVENSPWNILKRLRKDDRISSQAFHNLMVVLGIVNEVRLMAYLRSGKQDELFSFFDQSMDIDYELTKDFFLRFFYTVVPFQRAVKNFLSGFSENNAVDDILFPQDETFYEYSHLTSAVAISFTSYRFFREIVAKFQEALCSAEDESSQRLCLAFLSCLDPDYSIQYCNILLASTPSSEDEESSDWRIFSFLVASLASFHQDNVDGNVEKFLAAATRESSLVPVTNASFSSEPSRAQVVVQSYEILVRGLLKLNQQSDYEEALREFEAARVMYERNMQSKKLSMFTLFCEFMSGRCRIQLGNFQDSSLERAMRSAEIYTGNGQYMRILYHAYVGMVCLQQEDQDELAAKHCEKILELFLRFQCPKGQELWASIPAQGVTLVALLLGLLYQKMERVDDALRIFHLGSTRLISKALEFCEEKHHVGNDRFETAKMYVDALRAVFNLLKAECLHRKGREEEMWTQLREAVAQLAKYRGKFKPVDLREVFPNATTRESSARQGVKKDPAVWRMNLDSEPLTPPVADVFTMQPLLETWCDKITMVIQYILYTIERDVYGQLIQQGTPIISLLALLSPSLPEQFQSNPCAVLEVIIPALSQNPYAGQMVRGIFESTNAQRSAMFGEIRTSIAEIVRYAVEFTDGFIELNLLCLRLSLCHDLVNALGMFK